MLKYDPRYPRTLAGVAEKITADTKSASDAATAMTVPGEVRLQVVQGCVCVIARVCACLTVRVSHCACMRGCCTSARSWTMLSKSTRFTRSSWL